MTRSRITLAFGSVLSALRLCEPDDLAELRVSPYPYEALFVLLLMALMRLLPFMVCFWAGAFFALLTAGGR